MARRPIAVAITGGIGAGKSEALAAFARHGAQVMSSDQIVHRLLAEDEDVRAAIRERWGAEAVDDRAAIAEIVFRERSELDWLEALLHPRVVREYTRRRDAVDADLFVVEVPLLYETGADVRFDKVVVVSAPAAVRRERAPSLDERERRLIPDDEKLGRADFAYVNDGSLEGLDAFVADVVAKLAV